MTLRGLLFSVVFLGSFSASRGGSPGSEGTYFAVAFSPISHDFPSGGELIISTKQNAEVNISTSTALSTISVPGNWSVSYPFDADTRTVQGVEQNGIIITSDTPITVHMASTESFNAHTPDSALVRPIISDGIEYFLAGYDEMSSSTGTPPHSFYMVVPSEDDTYVEIYRKTNGQYMLDASATLDTHQVFTQDAIYQTNGHLIDYTGGRVLATKPVRVYSGAGCVYLYEPGAHTGWRYMFESMPTLEELGTEYTTFPVAFGDEIGGYEVRVIAVSNNTEVTLFLDVQESMTLNMGDFHVVDYQYTRQAFHVSCSVPCMVVQYQKSLPWEGDDFGMSVFMAVLTPESHFSSSLVFSTSEMSIEQNAMTAIGLVVDTYPVTDLYLNDTSLADLNWMEAVGASCWYATMEIQPGFYNLISYGETERFGSYLYAYNHEYHASGFPVGYGGTPIVSTTVPTTPMTTTVAEPDDNQTAPLYDIILLGNFASSTGEDFTMDCTADYTQNLRTKAMSLIPELNSMIGSQLCSSLNADDIMVVSVSVLFMTNGPQGASEVKYLMKPSNSIRMESVPECAAELTAHLQDFDNWGDPVIPPVEGCPEPLFNPENFTDGSTGNDWMCQIQIEEFGDTFPRYSLSLRDTFTTDLGEELNADCIRDYTDSWRQTALSMVTEVNGRIDDGRMCPAQAGKLHVLSAVTGFSAQTTQGEMTVTYLIKIDDGSLYFNEVYQCVDEMFAFLQDHNNWESPPAPPGCPPLVFDTTLLSHDGEDWGC